MNTSDARQILAERLRAHLAKPEFALSFPQQRPWFLDQLQKDNPVYNLPLGYRIDGPVNVEALQRALTAVVHRHEILRSTYHTIDGVPKQRVGIATDVPLELHDLTSCADPEMHAQLIANAEAKRPFDLSCGPMLRASILKVAGDHHWFLLSLHHIACDAWSVGIIAREVSEAYSAAVSNATIDLAPNQLQYVDFMEWQSRLMSSPERRVLLEYWKERLVGIPACINLMTDKPRPPIQDYKGAHITFPLPDATLASIDTLARARGATPFAVLLSAFAALLSRYCGGEQVVLGSPVANRNMAHLESMVGFFTNTLVFRPDLSGNPDFASLVSRVGEETRQALAHQDLPFEILVEELRPDRDTAHSPVFQVMFIYWDGDDDATWTIPGCAFTSLPGDSKTAKFDLTLSLTRTGAGIQARLEYATSLFETETVERMATQFVTLLEAALAQPEIPIADIDALPQFERDKVLLHWGRGDEVDTEISTVHEMISRSAQSTPYAVAVIDGAQSLTYEALHARACGVAVSLQSLGVGPGHVVGIYLDRSVDTVVALCGVLQAGAAYLPLDPSYPSERLAFMCEDSGAKAVLTSRVSAGAAASLGVTIVCIENCPSRGAANLAESALDDLAYLIYTSGSTGKPKGVMLSHRNVAAFFAAMDVTFGGDGPGTWLAVTSISFDISVLELLWTLTRGFRIVIRPDETKFASASTPQPATNGRPASIRPVDFSLFYFGNDEAQGADKYHVVLEGARFADANGFVAVWTPERHFHPFGGLFPNPSVIGAAIAAVTTRIAVRAGSVVLPLHDPLRVAEEWAVVDNLSKGRVGISFASGWQPDDFVLAPNRYADRKVEMFRMIEEVRSLWRGESVRRRNGTGSEVNVGIHPKPIQQELPVWITSARHPDTFKMAGEAGAGLLTHLIGHSAEQLAEKIAIYRAAWRKGGWPGEGHVTLMLHTFVHPDIDVVRDTVREPLREYIRSSFDLMSGLGAALNIDLHELPKDELEDLLDGAFERFFATSGLLGTPTMVAAAIERLATLGVNEVGCLVDFGVPEDMTLSGLPHLAEARQIYLRNQVQATEPSGPESLAEQITRYGVTHLQCTPSFASIIVADDEARRALKTVKRMLVGGEALTPEVAKALNDSVGGSVHNMYGPTEATVWATTSQVRANSPIRIGTPLPGYQAYVVDAQLRPTPIGVPGELLLGGAAIARGYHNRPELTHERFVPDELGDSRGRLYRTGDLARWRASGELEFLGRLDFQVKLRGRRIELGEIDAALSEHPSIQSAVCDVRGSGESRGIVAYCVLVAGVAQLPAPDALRTFLSRTLPDHMLPSAYTSLPVFPLTPNGKVDRRALPEIEQVRPKLSTIFMAPKSSVEEGIAHVWRDLLKLPEVGVADNFFELGGNSILAVAVRSRLIATVDDSLSLIDMFRYPTIATLAEAILARRGDIAPTALKVDAVNDAALKRRAALARKGTVRPQEVR